MIKNLQKVAVAAAMATMVIAFSANAAVAPAASYTYTFKTFFDTSTIFNPFDTKTLDYSVGSLTIADITGGVKVTLSQNNTAFPANTTAGTYLDGLWLNGTWGVGTVAAISGPVASGGPTFLGLATIFKDGGYVYNGGISFASVGIPEGGTSVFTIKGTNVSAYNFAKSSNVPMIELANVGGIYNTSLSGGKVYFVASAPVPEPGTYALMALGLAGMALASRRARRTD